MDYYDRSELDLSDETLKIWNYPLSQKLLWKKTAEICTMPKSAYGFQTIKDHMTL